LKVLKSHEIFNAHLEASGISIASLFGNLYHQIDNNNKHF